MLARTPADYDEAAALYRRCRCNGETARKLIDRLAAVAMRAGAEVLHADTDFALLARHTSLRVHPVSVRMEPPATPTPVDSAFPLAVAG